MSRIYDEFYSPRLTDGLMDMNRKGVHLLVVRHTHDGKYPVTNVQAIDSDYVEYQMMVIHDTATSREEICQEIGEVVMRIQESIDHE